MIKTAIFLGSKKFGLNLFKSIYYSAPEVDWLVMCPSDEGDMRNNLADFVKFTSEHKIEMVTCASPSIVLKFITEIAPDIMIVCGYYRILPTKLLDKVPLGVWGIHNSLLPKYRGGAPLVWQMINREEFLGSSFFRFSSGVDDGPILSQVKIKNSSNLDIGQASDLIEREWIHKLPELWKLFCSGQAKPWEQDHNKATYCAQRKPCDGLIDWCLPSENVNAFILSQAHPYPKAFFKLGPMTIRVEKHDLDTRVIHGKPGQVFEASKDFVTICCGYSSAIRLLNLEIDGKVLPAYEIINSTKQRLID